MSARENPLWMAAPENQANTTYRKQPADKIPPSSTLLEQSETNIENKPNPPPPTLSAFYQHFVTIVVGVVSMVRARVW